MLSIQEKNGDISDNYTGILPYVFFFILEYSLIVLS